MIPERVRSSRESPLQPSIGEKISLINTKLREFAVKVTELSLPVFSRPRRVIDLGTALAIDDRTTAPAFWNHIIAGTIMAQVKGEFGRAEYRGIHPTKRRIKENQERAWEAVRQWNSHSRNGGVVDESTKAFKDAAFSFDWTSSAELVKELAQYSVDLAMLYQAIG